MITDIIETTKYITNRLSSSKIKISSPMYLYDSYRLLREVIDNLDCLAFHYLALKFSESYLQDSSLGEPVDKWRYFLNIDLDRLNESVKKYFLSLTGIGLEDGMNEKEEHEPFFLYNKIYHKRYYGLMTENYCVGRVEDKTTTLKTFQLILLNDRKNDPPREKYPYEYETKISKTIELDTYEKREALANLLYKRKDELIDEYNKFQKYIKDNFTLDDLLRQRYRPRFLEKGLQIVPYDENDRTEDSDFEEII